MTVKSVFCYECGKHIAFVEQENQRTVSKLCDTCSRIDPDPSHPDDMEEEVSPRCLDCGEREEFIIAYTGCVVYYEGSGDEDGYISEGRQSNIDLGRPEVTCANCGTDNVSYLGIV